jgi:hypothetical protein
MSRIARWLYRPALAAALLLTGLLDAGPAHAAGEQLYRANEFVVRRTPETQSRPIIGGSRVIWHEPAGEVRKVHGKNLATGQEFSFTTGNDYTEYDVDGDLLVTTEDELGKKGIFAYRLTDFSRLTVAALSGGSGFYRKHPRVSGGLVVWAEGSDSINGMDIHAHDLASGRSFVVCSHPAQQERPAVSGNVIVWADARHRAGSELSLFDIYGYEVTSGQEFRITRQPEVIGWPAISGNTVVWYAQRSGSHRLLAFDLTTGKETVIANLGSEPDLRGVDIDGDVVVWSARPDPAYGDADIYGYDLTKKQQFVVCRAIGDQVSPSIAGRTVVWTDLRHNGIGKYDNDSDIYGAALTPGPAAPPPFSGAPNAIDAKIQIVWPHGGLPVTQADRANIGTYLVLPGTLKPGPCQWHPNVQLWRAVNNGPARLVGSATMQGSSLLWEHNNVDVAPARDPANKVFFFVTVEGMPTRSNVWAHAADARTYFPKQDVPTGVGSPSGAVDAKIEIVWPHNGAPVSQATKANITANLFLPNTLTSVPTSWNGTVRLYRSLNNGVAQEVGTGVKRTVSQGGLTYPVWDFNNVDVSAARNAANKLYFYLVVDGVQTYSNVWAHGVDARTYAPQKDTLDGGCS